MMKIIEVNNLSFNYSKDTEILKDISFSIEEGEIFGFLGPNGSGKSTTQKIITGILDGYSGEVSILGENLKNLDYKIYHELSVLFEHPYLYSNLSAIDNLKYFSSFYSKDRVRDIDKILDRLNLKMDFRNKSVSKYSKGMKQRVSMARALISSPKILFLDEPTSGLDPAGSVLFREIILEEKKKGTTIFLTTHNMHDAELLCDRIAFIVDGKIVSIDTPTNYKMANNDSRVNLRYKVNNEIEESTIDIKDLKTNSNFLNDEIVSIHTAELNLEDIFIKLTGKELS